MTRVQMMSLWHLLQRLQLSGGRLGNVIRYGSASFLLLLAFGSLAGPLADALRARAQQRGNEVTSPIDSEAGEAQSDESRTKRSLRRESMPPNTRSWKDLAYGSDPQQRLDVYAPPGAKAAPMILLVHGGAWMIGDKAHAPVVANKLARWLPKGFVVASTNYRMSKNPNPSDQVEDVAHALAYIQANAASWGGEPGKVVLVGHSAGAHLVSMLASDPGIVERAGGQSWRGTVSLDSASMNVVEVMERKHHRIYDRVFGDSPEKWRKISPFHHLSAMSGRQLLVCSSRRTDSCEQASSYAERAEALKVPVTVFPVDLGHGAINTDLGKQNGLTVEVERFMKQVGVL